MGTLAGKTALVTGASRGIGRGIAQRLAREGALVAVHYGSNEAAARDTLAAITTAGGQAFVLRTELGRAGDAHALWSAFDKGVREFTDSPHVDVIVNNAGIALYAPVGDVADTSFDEVFAVNAKAPFFILQHGLDRLRDGGRIINISSGAARLATPMLIAYAMTKGALNALTRTLALELGPRNITVNSVEPGIVETDITFFLSDPRMSELAASWSAFNRLGQPADIADVVAFLASPDSRWITGQAIDASGGLLLGPTF
ncbi:SDR family oxidoreductase [Frankia sp. CNm7]|uniref:SDR family oxidoreductase n=1 Tax=Frankia nepalensis TaxID=1836974 RepID=A0A937RSX5_9ACTN|nr:SDR family oxidoreductase [Frankia nepalensis]MBL7498874.1 SDR family oxidoreductase [Frankia nepalensis]MBL7513706.1 SDR family oxidoreductase [Frankia nepalensis]MBL7522400.1 SDR family oxidoreductase [Frankia nepalensis]MBL7631346.1 SDR family oxidoreductase [Frankia nepalensis]